MVFENNCTYPMIKCNNLKINMYATFCSYVDNVSRTYWSYFNHCISVFYLYLRESVISTREEMIRQNRSNRRNRFLNRFSSSPSIWNELPREVAEGRTIESSKISWISNIIVWTSALTHLHPNQSQHTVNIIVHLNSWAQRWLFILACGIYSSMLN